jgi:putative protease
MRRWRIANKLELLAPAGDLEKLIYAVEYGADAVYFGGPVGGLRAGAGNLSVGEIGEGVRYCHSRGKKAYLTLNYYPRQEDERPLADFLEAIADHLPDGFIVSDPGVLDLLKAQIPTLSREGGPEIHLSTQANVTNAAAARFWYRQGVRRLIAARELSLTEIEALRRNLPADMHIEAFVQGAMCIAYSGRCLLSSWMAGRDANRGDCSQPCRWSYALVEEQRPGEYFPIEEDEQGSYVLNSGDLCMLEHLPDLIHAGITSAKIEGRIKSIFYVATVLRAWRQAIDAWQTATAEGREYRCDPAWMTELKKASHRPFTTGFYYGDPGMAGLNSRVGGYVRGCDFLGVVLDYDPVTKLAKVEQRNKMILGDKVEIFGPDPGFATQRIGALYDEEKRPIESAPHPQQQVYIPVETPVQKFYMIRKVTK